MSTVCFIIFERRSICRLGEWRWKWKRSLVYWRGRKKEKRRTPSNIYGNVLIIHTCLNKTHRDREELSLSIRRTHAETGREGKPNK